MNQQTSQEMEGSNIYRCLSHSHHNTTAPFVLLMNATFPSFMLKAGYHLTCGKFLGKICCEVRSQCLHVQLYRFTPVQ